MGVIRKVIACLYHKIDTRVQGIKYFLDDWKYFMRFSNLGSKNQSEAQMRSSLIASYHIIEKGLSMPDRRLGFGHDRLIGLINVCRKYYSDYGTHAQLSYAVAIIREYDDVHKANHFELEPQLQEQIDSLLASFPDVNPAQQYVYTKTEFFSKVNSAFDDFSSSRHSMRHFSGPVSSEKIVKAIELAKNAPSACNKQPVRVYMSTLPEKNQKILNLQQGNRGFGHNIDKVLVVTTQFSECTRYSEQYMPFVDAGIFSMNLLYSLHFCEIGAIPLVWLSTKERDKELREILSIPEFEKPALIIGVGNVSDNIVCAQSPRLSSDELLKIR